jgi:putative flippase GtrA
MEGMAGTKSMHRFLKFGALSGGGWLLDCGLLLVLSQAIGLSLPVANFLSSSVAALTVFSASRFLIFRAARSKPLLKTFIYFLYTSGIIILASTVIGPVLAWIEFMRHYIGIQLTPAQAAFIAKVVITPPQLLANFMVSRYLSETTLTRSGDNIAR